MKLQKTFTSVFRLIGVYEDETAFILPLQAASPADARMLSVSTREPLVFVCAANMDVVRQSPAFVTIERRCSDLVRAYMNSLHVLVSAPDMEALARGSQLLRNTENRRNDEPTNRSHDNDEINRVYDEIDDIYRYVRQGGDPPCPRSHPTSAETTPDDKGPQQSVPAIQHAGSDQNAADYTWEEPIYEDIEKIRQRKRQRATTTTTTTELTTTTTNTTTTTTTSVDQTNQTSDELMPVGNLRQLIKRFSEVELSTSSVRQDRAPPVPPKLSVNIINAPAGQSEARQVDGTTSQRAGEVVDYSVSLSVEDDTSAGHFVNTTLSPISPAGVDDSQPPAGCITSVHVSPDVNHHHQHQTSPFYCSRVSVIGGVSSARPVDTQSTVTRITTLGRQSARRHDVHQSTS